MEAKKTLQLGSGLSSGPFTDLMIRATDRGRQLIRSMGLAIGSPDEAISSSHEQNVTGLIPHPPPIKPTIGKEQAVFPPKTNRLLPFEPSRLKHSKPFRTRCKQQKISMAYSGRLYNLYIGMPDLTV